MTSLIGFTVFGVDWVFLKPFIVLGLALGGVYALSGVGLVVLYRATGVLNIAFGAIGAAGALIAYYIVNHTGWPHWLAYLVCVVFGGVVNLAYGMVFGPAFARRDPLVKMMGTLALALILIYVFSIQLDWLPFVYRADIPDVGWRWWWARRWRCTRGAHRRWGWARGSP